MERMPAAPDEDAPRVEADDDPPTHHEFPSGTLVAVAADDDVAVEIVACMRDVGGDHPHLLENTVVLLEDAHRRVEQGHLSALVQALGALVSDQRPLQDRYLAHARAGHPMVVVNAPDAETANRLWAVMRDHGAYEGTWFGRRVIHEMV